MTAIEQGPLIPNTNMATTLRTPHVKTVLARLFAAAAQDQETPRWRTPEVSWETASAQERADASESTYTIYPAAAVADNGTGCVVTTELNEAKVRAARASLEEARLADRVTILHGDAMKTLNEIPGPIDLVLLDGWKDLYLPVLRSLESRLTIGALIVADDINFPSVSEYLDYVRDPANGYVSVAFPVDDGMEISCWTPDGRSSKKGAL
jgi:hypothetical protein